MVAEPMQLTAEALADLVAALQVQVRELIAENEALRRGAFTRWNEPVPGETDEERADRIARGPRVTVRRRPAGPVPPFKPFPGPNSFDILKLLGRRDDGDEESDG